MKNILATLFLSAALLLTGCIKNPVQSTAGQPTPFQQALAYNTALAQTNSSIAQSVVLLNSNAVLSTSSTETVLSVQKKIAEADIQLSTLLNNGPTFSAADTASILSLIQQINAAAATLTIQGVIPNTPEAQQLQTEATSLISIIQTVISELAVAGVK